MQFAKEKMTKPRRLQPGDTIGIVAPASPFKRDALEQGIAALHALGYDTKLAEGLFASQGYLAGDDSLRASQLQDMFTDDDVQAVMCARGGYGALRILSRLDFALIGSQSKAFIGFSDISALHQAFLLKAGSTTFHGPAVCTLAKSDEMTRSALHQALSDSRPIHIMAQRPRTILPGVAQGIVVGGNLTTLCHLAGTPFATGYKDCILVLEDRGEATYRIDRMLTQMMLAGCFDGLAGLVLGSFRDCGPDSDIDALVHDLFGELKIPIMAGVAVGHEDTNLTLPMGIPARLNADKGDLTYLEVATENRAGTTE